MKKLIVLWLSLFISQINQAQDPVIWGSGIVELSSEFGTYEYAGVQALHKPNVLPDGGDSPNAWRPKKPNSEEFIMVSFDTLITAKQIAIAESENPGAVTRILAYDQEYHEYELFPELKPHPLPRESRLLNLFFERTPYKIAAIKVILDGEAVDGYNAIDAIGISSSNIPINVLIRLVKNINQNIVTNRISDNVNSSYSEHSPVLSPDGKRLYFSRQYHPDNVGGVDDEEDIWVSELDEETGEWLPAKNVGAPLNTTGPNFISSISLIDGKEVFLLGNEYGRNRMHTGISISTLNGDSFEKPKALKIKDFYNYSPNVDFFLVSGGHAIIISVERDDSYGARGLICFICK